MHTLVVMGEYGRMEKSGSNFESIIVFLSGLRLGHVKLLFGIAYICALFKWIG